MRIAIAQFTVGANVSDNTQLICGLISDASAGGAALVVFPEAAMRRIGPPGDNLGAVAESLDGPFTQALAEASRAAGIWVLAGMWERNPTDARVLNTVVAIAPGQGVVGRYRKIHLFDALGARESDRVAAGAGDTMVFDLHGLRFGVMTCYDIRFPELARLLVDQGAEVLVVPAAWQHGLLKEDQWITLCKARALENTSWLVGAAQVGGGCSGHSLIVDPMGLVVHTMGEESGLLFGDLHRERVQTVRARIPVLGNRRLTVGWPNRDLAESDTTPAG